MTVKTIISIRQQYYRKCASHTRSLDGDILTLGNFELVMIEVIDDFDCKIIKMFMMNTGPRP